MVYTTYTLIIQKCILCKGLPAGISGKESAHQCRRHKRCGFCPWVGKISWRIARYPTPVFLPGESHGPRSLVGYSPKGCKESDMAWDVCTHAIQKSLKSFIRQIWTCFCFLVLPLINCFHFSSFSFSFCTQSTKGQVNWRHKRFREAIQRKYDYLQINLLVKV